MTHGSGSAFPFRRRHVILWCAFIIAFAGLNSKGNAGEKAKSRFHALCVGLRYPGTGRELRFTTSDVRAVAKAFAAASGYDEMSSNIECLADDDPRQAKPTPHEVRRRLGSMVAASGPEDRIVFYFSGHGLRSRDDRSILVCHTEGRGGDDKLFLSEIRDILDGSPAKDKLLIIDACHSGGKSTSDGLEPASLAKSLSGAGKAAGRDTVAWLVSCDVSEQSWEDEEAKQGLFTRFFLEAVGPNSALADTNYDGMLSLPELNKYISTAIGYYIHSRKMNRDRDWLTRSQSPRMGKGGTISLNGEDLQAVSVFYCSPNSPPLPARYDLSMSLEQCREFAANGDAEAQNHLGYMYRYGKKGLPKSDFEAARWYRLSADQGHAAAQSNLGHLYFLGDGVPRDYSEALRLFHLSANQGEATAQNNLGYMYKSGTGVQANYREAERWYRLAADQGNAAAQYNLGDMLESGKSGRQDTYEAIRLYRLAAAQGNQNAKKALLRLRVQ